MTPIREVDHRRIGAGERGPVAKQLQEAFFEVVKGGQASKRYAEWLSFI